MSKTIKNVFDQKLSFMYLMKAHERASKNKQNRKDVIKYNVDLETNLTNLLERIKNDHYHSGKYREFTIYEPKERKIQGPSL